MWRLDLGEDSVLCAALWLPVSHSSEAFSKEPTESLCNSINLVYSGAGVERVLTLQPGFNVWYHIWFLKPHQD